ncbi:MAG: DUF2520 domain-containing protein, partial [Bacteroidales bacterium]|nr:DUF2520 domain-containing protein [Bacteroidales bacterium]
TKIAIIGTGNIGTWLFKTLQNQEHLSVISVSSRKIETLPQDCDLYIFALKDDVYGDVLQQIPFKMSCAVHTSGSLSQSILAPFAERGGVVYPYQTVTQKGEGRREKGEGRKEKGEGRRGVCHAELVSASHKIAGDPETSSGRNDEGVDGEAGRGSLTPICIEASDVDFENALFQWANSVFDMVYKIDEKQRFAMHLAAVFANNFTNAMYGVAYQIFKENNLDWSLIFPLLENGLEKAKQNDPRLIQTGPAKRNDVSIMDKHCNALGDGDLEMLYKMVSKIILTTNH